MPTTTIEPTMISNASCATETKRPHPSPPSRHKLARPFVLPQQAYNPDSPFVRGYSPMLPVTETAFISFIDRLNVAMLKKPEDQVVALATSASMVLPGIGTALGAVAVGAGAEAHAATEQKKAVDAVLKDANRDMFRPYGLETSLLSTQQLHDLLLLPPLEPDTLPDELPHPDKPKPVARPSLTKLKKLSNPPPEPCPCTKLPLDIDRLKPYAPYILEPTKTLPAVKVTYHGRTDVLASTAASCQLWYTQKKEGLAAKEAAKGHRHKLAKMHRKALWNLFVQWYARLLSDHHVLLSYRTLTVTDSGQHDDCDRIPLTATAHGSKNDEDGLYPQFANDSPIPAIRMAVAAAKR